MHDTEQYPLVEEVLNAVTHGIGVALSIVGLTLMVVYAAGTADPWRITSVSIFGATLIILYLASTLYHAFPQQKVKEALRVCDHCAIYLLIAGTYTPFLLVNLRGPWGYSLMVVLWTAALAGCVYKIFFINHFRVISTLLYIAMGWTAVIAVKPLLATTPAAAAILMLVGGLLYSGGAVFYLWDRLPFNHAIWHLFVMGGSISHFFAVFWYIVPLNQGIAATT